MANQSISPENMSNKKNGIFNLSGKYLIYFLVIIVLGLLTIFFLESCEDSDKRCTNTTEKCPESDCSTSYNLISVIDTTKYDSTYLFPIVNNELVIDYTKVTMDDIFDSYKDYTETIDTANKSNEEIFRLVMEEEVREYLSAEANNIYTLDSSNVAFNEDVGEFIQCVCGTNLFTYRNKTLIFKEHEPQTSNTTSQPQKESDIQLNMLFQANDVKDKIQTVPPAGRRPNNDKKVVAFLDSGVSTIIDNSYLYFADSDLDSCVADGGLNGYNFTYDGTQNDITDRDGHGTLSILSFINAVKKLENRNMFSKQFKILTVKILDACGYGTTSSLACGLYYAEARNADIINISLGYENEDSVVFNALDTIATDRRERQKTLIVCSAGNDTLNLTNSTTHFPSQYTTSMKNVFEVGALCNDIDSEGNNKKLAHYSNYRNNGSFMVENGNNVQKLISSSADTCSINGTSFAAPRFSAGLLYLLWQNESNPANPPIDIGSIIDNDSLQVRNKRYYSIVDNPRFND